MNDWNDLVIADIDTVSQAWYPHLVNLNDYLHFRRDWGVAIVIGFTNKKKADRWLRKHCSEERHNVALRHFSTEMAGTLWTPHFMIIKDLNMDWDLERIKEWDAEQ